MRIRDLIRASCTLLLGGWFSSAHAQPPPPPPGTPIGVGANKFVVDIEEDTLGAPNGFLNGRISMNGGPFAQMQDRLVGGVPSVVTPFSFVEGDLLLMEPGHPPPPNDISDLLRFHTDPTDGSPVICFYSDALPPETSGFMEITPPAPLANMVAIPEIGPEGSNGARYVAGNVTYIVRSDVVPEPAAIVQLAIGTGLIGCLVWRRRAGRRG